MSGHDMLSAVSVHLLRRSEPIKGNTDAGGWFTMTRVPTVHTLITECPLCDMGIPVHTNKSRLARPNLISERWQTGDAACTYYGAHWAGVPMHSLRAKTIMANRSRVGPEWVA